MFCMKCGKPTEGDQILCPDCLNQQPQQPAAAPEEAAAPLWEQTVFVEQTPTEPQPEVPQSEPVQPQPQKKKGKAGLIAAIVAGALVLALGLTTVFCWGFVSNLCMDWFTSPEDYLEFAALRTLTKGDGLFAGEPDYLTRYQKNLEAARDAYSSGNPIQNEELSYRLELDPSVVELVLRASDAPEELSADTFTDILLNLQINTTDTGISLNAAAGLKGVELLTLNFLMNMEDGGAWMQIPELTEAYLHAPTGAMSVGQSAPYNMFPDSDMLLELLERYIPLIVEELDEVEKDTDTVKAGDLRKKLTTLTVEMSQKEFISLRATLVEEFSRDEDILDLLQIYCDDYNKRYEEYIDAGFVTQLTPEDLLEQWEDSLDAAREDIDSSDPVEFMFYVDNKGRIVGFTIKSSGEKLELLLLRKGDAFGLKILLPNDTLYLTAEGTEVDGVIDGTATLEIGGMSVGTLEISQLVSNDEVGSGTITLKPHEDFLSFVLEELGLPEGIAALLDADDTTMKIELDGTYRQATVVMTLNAGSLQIAKLTAQASVTQPTEITFPTESVTPQQWKQSISQENLKVLFEKAGLYNAFAYLFEVKEPELPHYTNGTPQGALTILENTWFNFCQYTEIPVFGGDYDNVVDGAPGLSTNEDYLLYTMLVPQQEVGQITGAATVTHAMMGNNFTCGVYSMEQDPYMFADAMAEAILSNQWMCGMPEELVIMVIDNTYVLVCYGIRDFTEPLAECVAGLYPTAEILYHQPITG